MKELSQDVFEGSKRLVAVGSELKFSMREVKTIYQQVFIPTAAYGTELIGIERSIYT